MGCKPEMPRPSGKSRGSEPLPHSEKLRFDPGRCEDNDGLAYVSLGSVVVRVPYDGEPVSRNMASEASRDLPAPPRRDAPEGCRGRPSPAIELNLTRYQAMVLEGKFSDARPPLTRLSVNWLDTDRSHLQEVSESLASTLQRDKQCVNLDRHMAACSKNPRSITYITRSDYGSAPDGRPLVVICGTGTSLSENDCWVSYRLRAEVALNYRFDRRRVSRDRIIQLDQALRSGVSEMIDSTFVWPEPRSNNQ